MSKYKKNEDILSIMSNLQPNCCLKSISKRWTNMQGASGQSTTPSVARTISCKAWNSPTEYPSWVARCDVKGSDGTMNPIFWKKVQGQKHPGRGRIVEHQIPSIKVLFKINATNQCLIANFQWTCFARLDYTRKFRSPLCSYILSLT